jgi:hypothetical protein
VSPKKASLVSLVVIGLALPEVILAEKLLPASLSPFSMLLLAQIGAGFFIAGRIKCPRCGATLAGQKGKTASSIPLLWAAREKCSECGESLEY